MTFDTKEYYKQYYLDRKELYNKRSKDYYYKTIDRRKELSDQRYADNKETIWAYKMEKLYGMTVEQYYELEKQQDFKCKVCKSGKRSKNGKLDVDHCHTTGKVRGLLCRKCNATIGRLEEETSAGLVIDLILQYLNR